VIERFSEFDRVDQGLPRTVLPSVGFQPIASNQKGSHGTAVSFYTDLAKIAAFTEQKGPLVDVCGLYMCLRQFVSPPLFFGLFPLNPCFPKKPVKYLLGYISDTLKDIFCQALNLYVLNYFQKNGFNPYVNAGGAMIFPEKLVEIRKQRGFTQQAMADKIGIHVSQIKRYEAGTAQPTLEIFYKIVLALNVSADSMLFKKNQRGPDEDLKLYFEAVSKLTAKEKNTIKELIEGMLIKHDANRWINKDGGRIELNTRS